MTPEAGAVRCGQPFRLPDPGGLRVAGRFPETVPPGRRTLRGEVEVTSSESVRGVTAPGADVFLVRGDEIVTTPIAQDAVGVVWESAAGETRSMPAVASLVSCGPDGGPLAAGLYEVYARVTVTADDGTSQRGFGGPWPLRLE